MGSVIKNAVLTYLLEQGFINKLQHSLSPSVLHVRNYLSALLTGLSLSLSHKQSIDVAYFWRDFDSVVHSKLYLKLKSLGISSNLLNWISDFLSIRLQAVIVGNSAPKRRPPRKCTRTNFI